MNIFSKLKFLFKKPKVVIIVGDGRAGAKEAILQILKQYPMVGKNVFVLAAGLAEDRERKEIKQLIKNSKLPILVATHMSDISLHSTVFAGQKEGADIVRDLAKQLPRFGRLIINLDDQTVRKIGDGLNVKESTFGFGQGAELRVTDIHQNPGVNFKVDYQGNLVPVWLEGVFGKEQIYSALAASAVGTVLGLNLVEISQALRNCRFLPGKTQLIEGIKNSKILDDSEKERYGQGKNFPL